MVAPTSLDNTIEHLTQDYVYEGKSKNVGLFNERKKRYYGKNVYCGNDFLYHPGKHKLIHSSCNSWSCERCRPRKMKNLLNVIVEQANDKNLTRHLVITSAGKDFREKFSPDESFDFFAKQFNQLRKYYRREFSHNLSYIALPRSQEDGFCHYHCLIGSYIPKNWLDNVLKKLGLGWCFITYVDVHRLANYLSKYWYKEHEWFIPKGKKHYTHSADVDLTLFAPEDNWYFIGVPRIISPIVVANCIYECTNFLSGRPPPFDFLVGCFYDNLNFRLSDKGDYVSFLKRHGYPNLEMSIKPDYKGVFQCRLQGQAFKWIMKEPKSGFVKQRKFRKGFYNAKGKYIESNA
ncbi:hypothetical protein MBGDN05_00784 [Thermoplasmatales archaeon SCGC AB-539-N05]|nr:hypothetical protein MBGDN05_00784 [Thermoplasmatales archaeon SCGC AB-539-N05]